MSSDNEDLSPSSTHLQYCKRFIDEHISGWNVESPNENGIQLVINPTVSELPHDALHPALLRCVGDVGGINNLAEILSAPSDWEQLIRLAYETNRIPAQLNQVRSLPAGTGKGEIQERFVDIIRSLAHALNLSVKPEGRKKMAIGGILAYPEFDIKGEADICLFNEEGECVAVFEFKTPEEFYNDNWYRDCRGAQILTALYHFNAPTFLVTPTQWKLFIENQARDSILTLPTLRSIGETVISGPFANSMQIGSIGREFLLAVGLCMLSKPSPLSSEKFLETPRNNILEENKRKRSETQKNSDEGPPSKRGDPVGV